MTINVLITVFIGFAGGLAVGSGFVAFLTVLGIIPRLTQLTKTMKMIHYYEMAVITGALAGGFISLNDYTLHFSPLVLIPLGLMSGVFIGLLAAALTEVLNVFPILAKRIGIDGQIVILIMAIVFGKIFGSLFHWLYLVHQ
ncbi:MULTISPECIES: stage V sporulation protein AB [Rossellomorea]|jgi:stage V sporulation protein AB|uniref:Stage V sporulation protein AB n=2 Tax=Rossellomorea vietnamensis TaxID=218284 RepID=A0A6I6UL97_9BACI|nr:MULTISPECIES: stage V sporulation protein AB [Rossellomorea]MCA0147748.1 stage V sporulation protein AB [Rossellomorea vietnamensis]MCC5800336.1 stage V sporulation protein AB [Rossellomorea vietnamensis]QHE62057.1 stage V sporulation protein AB [Rossellomorea vietnamensis]UTE76209.1 stage V sporulation protein AB [Rossellomorea sp. KS-H15a]UXH44583.1 stage V sporulation protein AB [Rossellomorea vietnamensis]